MTYFHHFLRTIAGVLVAPGKKSSMISHCVVLLRIRLSKFGCQFDLECLTADSSQAPCLRNDPHWTESSFFRVWWHLSDAVAVFFLRNRKGAGDHLDAEEVGPIVSIEGIPSAS